MSKEEMVAFIKGLPSNTVFTGDIMQSYCGEVEGDFTYKGRYSGCDYGVKETKEYATMDYERAYYDLLIKYEKQHTIIDSLIHYIQNS